MVLLRSKVLEWVQPKPTVTNGEAWVGLDCAPVWSVAGFCDGVVVLSGGAPLVPGWLADALCVLEGDVEFFPSLVADAVADVGGESPAQDNTHHVVGSAVLAAASFADDVLVAADGWVGVFLGVDGFPVVHQIGVAEIVFPEDAPAGSAPIFPFRFPMLFVIPGFTVLSGDALLDFSGDVLPIVGVDGVAVVSTLSGEGVTESGVIGDNLYAVYGVAGVGFSGVVSQTPVVDGLSDVVFDGFVAAVLGGVFPTVLPFTFV